MGSISGDALVTGVDTTPGTFRCHRGRLEQFLRENQDIKWEHTIKDIETTPQKVIVRIQNEQAIVPAMQLDKSSKDLQLCVLKIIFIT